MATSAQTITSANSANVADQLADADGHVRDSLADCRLDEGGQDYMVRADLPQAAIPDARMNQRASHRRTCAAIVALWLYAVAALMVPRSWSAARRG